MKHISQYISSLRVMVSVLLIVLSGTIHAQSITIPDANFLSWLQSNGFSSCISGNQLNTSCAAVLGANKIDCSSQNIVDLTGIEAFVNLDSLICNFNDLISINALPPNLIYLKCTNNYDLASIASFPASLQEIQVVMGSLTTLPALPSGLTDLQIFNNQLNSLPPLPSGMTYFHCGANNLGSYFSTNPVLPSSLTIFYCYGNNITSLPTLPSTLMLLSCSNNDLTSLPPFLPANLNVLYCDGNQLTSLGTIPSNLGELNCSNNLLTSMPALPSSVNFLNCSNNQLTTFNLCSTSGFANTFTQLSCSFNQLQHFDTVGCPLGFSNSANISLSVNDNQFIDLPLLPMTINALYVNNNPSLSCLPEFNQITTLNFSNTGIQCLPTYGSVTNSTPSLASMVLCDPFNFNNCNWNYNITGRTYQDVNTNCLYDTGEMDFSNIKIQLYQGGSPFMQTFTGGEGYYSFDTPLGNYSYFVDDTGMPYEAECPVVIFHNSTLTAFDSTDTNMDFALKCKTGVDLGTISMDNGLLDLRPGHTIQLQPSIGDISKLYNLNCAAGIGGTVTITFSGPVTYTGPLSGALTPVVGSNTLEYTVADFGTINLNGPFGFAMTINTSAQAGQQICFVVDVTPVAGDINPTNNTFQHCYAVVNSFDPNDKLVSPVGDIENTQEWLTYTVRFQNTGTAPAEHIYILDTLDANLNEGSLELLGTSHPAQVTVSGNVVRFNFSFINLPDSNANEPASHGFVTYRIRINPSLSIGTVISNSAAIFFDFNPPVITNIASNEIVNPTAVPELNSGSVHIYPNPANTSIKVVAGNSSGTLKITDVSGRLLISKPIERASDEQQIDVSGLSNGVYFIHVDSGNHVLRGRFVKE